MSGIGDCAGGGGGGVTVRYIWTDRIMSYGSSCPITIM